MMRALVSVLLMAAASAFAQAPERFAPNEGRVLEVDKRAGDRVKFKAGLVGGRFAVISITPVKPQRKESK